MGWLCLTTPAIGPMMGIAIFFRIQNVVRNIPTQIMGIFYFNNIMKKEGISRLGLLWSRFYLEEIKECSIYGIKMGLPGIISNISALAQLWIWLIYVPQYVSLDILQVLRMESLDSLIRHLFMTLPL